MRKARIITTLECNRSCPYCCIKYPEIKAQMQPIDTLDKIHGYDEIIITGGEPMLEPSRTLGIMKTLYQFNPGCKMYLYTAYYKAYLARFITYFDGIHYTLHEASTPEDITDFHRLQRNIIAWKLDGHQEQSFRLYAHPGIKHPITIHPWVWSRVEIKPWMPAGECPLPEHEELFLLQPRR